MTQPQSDQIHPLGILFNRCCTMADRVRANEIAFLDAVDFMWSAAEFSGLVDRFGPDQVQAVLADAFIGVPRTCTT